MARKRNTTVEKPVEEKVVDPIPEVIESVVTETPKVKETQAEPIPEVTESVVTETKEDVKSDFISQTDSCKDLVEYINKSKSIDIKNVTDILGSIDNYLLSVKGNNKSTILSNKYSLYLTIRNMIENENYSLFKQKMDILNIAFISDKTGLFNPVALLKDDYLWSYGSGSRVAYQLTITAISRLSKISERSKNLKLVDIRSILKYYNITASNNIIRYYDL